jgi:hypothetical protein
MKTLVIALSVTGKGWKKGDGGSHLTKARCKPIQNCYNNPPYNEYVLIKVEN